MNYGLRYDIEWLSKYRGSTTATTTNNFGPRLALSYDLTGNGRTLLKFSNGLYYDRIFQNPIQPTLFGPRKPPAGHRHLELRARPAHRSTRRRFRERAAGRMPQLGSATSTSFPTTGMMRDAGVLSVRWRRSTTPSATIWPSPPACSTAARGTRSSSTTSTFVFDEATQRWCGRTRRSASSSVQPTKGKPNTPGSSLEARKRHAIGVLLQRATRPGRGPTTRATTSVRSRTTPGYPEREWGPQADTPTFRMAANGVLRVQQADVASGDLPRPHRLCVRSARARHARSERRRPFSTIASPGLSRNSFRMPGNNSLDMRFTWQPAARGSAPAAGRRSRPSTSTTATTCGRSNQHVRILADSRRISSSDPLTYYNPRESCSSAFGSCSEA